MQNEKRKIEISASQAREQYNEYRNIDPFPSIPCALLNSSDIIDYVEKVAMINPFYIDDALIKPASVSIQLGGSYIYWDSNEKKVSGNLESLI